MGPNRAPQPSNIPAEWENIRIKCPVPGVADGQELTVAEFYQTERGKAFLDPAIDNAKTLQESGIEGDQAFIIASGGAAIVDKEGTLVRSEQDYDIYNPAKKKF